MEKKEIIKKHSKTDFHTHTLITYLLPRPNQTKQTHKQQKIKHFVSPIKNQN